MSANLITAYEIHDGTMMPIEPAPIARAWMEQTPVGFAYRCLPMVIANQAGWVIASPASFRIYWYGGQRTEDLEVRFDDAFDNRVHSVFGNGILTFSLPYLFRTPPGINLWVKGPTNLPKDGIHALEGVVETDWSPATFTMNWLVTRPFNWVEFKRGEPICMILPIPRGLAETLSPQQIPLKNNQQLQQQYETWSKGRTEFLQGLKTNDPEAVKLGWQKDYFKGENPVDGERFEPHQTRLALKKFVPDRS